MSETKMNSWLKMALELGPIIGFFVAYRYAPVAEGANEGEKQLSQILFATAVFIPMILASLGFSWVKTRHLPKMAAITAVLVLVFGGLTLWLRDDTFIKMKPTILYLMFAGGLGFGLLRGQSYLKYLMEDMMPLKDEGWMKFTRRFVVFFVVLAVANELVWRNFDTDFWVNFKTFGLPLASFAFIMSQASIFTKYAIDES